MPSDWIQPGALLTVVLELAGFFRKELKDLRAEQKAELKDLKLERKADNRVLNDKLDRLLESNMAAKP